MNLLSRILLSIMFVGSMVYGNTYGAAWRSRPVAIKTTRQGPSKTEKAAEPLSLVKKRSASKGKTQEEGLAVNVLGRGKRQAFHDMSEDPSLMLFDHPSEHGTFNQDTYSCDEVMSSPCKRPSDCHGCLGLFTCKMPQGRCDFKGLSKTTGIFYQSLQAEETSDGDAH